MKRMLRSVAESKGTEYQLWAELTPCGCPGELYRFKFSSVWTGAKDPDASQSRAEFFLEKSDIMRLQKLFEDAVR